MEKSIKMSEDTWKKLNHYKYSLGASSMDDVIQALIKISSELKLANQIKKEERKNERSTTNN